MADKNKGQYGASISVAFEMQQESVNALISTLSGAFSKSFEQAMKSDGWKDFETKTALAGRNISASFVKGFESDLKKVNNQFNKFVSGLKKVDLFEATQFDDLTKKIKEALRTGVDLNGLGGISGKAASGKYKRVDWSKVSEIEDSVSGFSKQLKDALLGADLGGEASSVIEKFLDDLKDSLGPSVKLSAADLLSKVPDEIKETVQNLLMENVKKASSGKKDFVDILKSLDLDSVTGDFEEAFGRVFGSLREGLTEAGVSVTDSEAETLRKNLEKVFLDAKGSMGSSTSEEMVTEMKNVLEGVLKGKEEFVNAAKLFDEFNAETFEEFLKNFEAMEESKKARDNILKAQERAAREVASKVEGGLDIIKDLLEGKIPSSLNFGAVLRSMSKVAFAKGGFSGGLSAAGGELSSMVKIGMDILSKMNPLVLAAGAVVVLIKLITMIWSRIAEMNKMVKVAAVETMARGDSTASDASAIFENQISRANALVSAYGKSLLTFEEAANLLNDLAAAGYGVGIANEEALAKSTKSWVGLADTMGMAVSQLSTDLVGLLVDLGGATDILGTQMNSVYASVKLSNLSLSQFYHLTIDLVKQFDINTSQIGSFSTVLGKLTDSLILTRKEAMESAKALSNMFGKVTAEQASQMASLIGGNEGPKKMIRLLGEAQNQMEAAMKEDAKAIVGKDNVDQFWEVMKKRGVDAALRSVGSSADALKETNKEHLEALKQMGMKMSDTTAALQFLDKFGWEPEVAANLMQQMPAEMMGLVLPEMMTAMGKYSLHGVTGETKMDQSAISGMFIKSTAFKGMAAALGMKTPEEQEAFRDVMKAKMQDISEKYAAEHGGAQMTWDQMQKELNDFFKQGGADQIKRDTEAIGQKTRSLMMTPWDQLERFFGNYFNEVIDGIYKIVNKFSFSISPRDKATKQVENYTKNISDILKQDAALNKKYGGSAETAIDQEVLKMKAANPNWESDAKYAGETKSTKEKMLRAEAAKKVAESMGGGITMGQTQKMGEELVGRTGGQIFWDWTVGWFTSAKKEQDEAMQRAFDAIDVAAAMKGKLDPSTGPVDADGYAAENGHTQEEWAKADAQTRKKWVLEMKARKNEAAAAAGAPLGPLSPWAPLDVGGPGSSAVPGGDAAIRKKTEEMVANALKKQQEEKKDGAAAEGTASKSVTIMQQTVNVGNMNDGEFNKLLESGFNSNPSSDGSPVQTAPQKPNSRWW